MCFMGCRIVPVVPDLCLTRRIAILLRTFCELRFSHGLIMVSLKFNMTRQAHIFFATMSCGNPEVPGYRVKRRLGGEVEARSLLARGGFKMLVWWCGMLLSAADLLFHPLVFGLSQFCGCVDVFLLVWQPWIFDNKLYSSFLSFL